ncbi:MAG: peroxide stress protein YaaA [Alphaproteobacteria bacterium]|nr:peroxide stress protein YaaA [Alphaproteobacteria bacterium]
MLIVLSPSKTLDYESESRLIRYSQPDMLLKSQLLVAELKTYSTDKLADLMEISDKLATLNAQRYRAFKVPFTLHNARQALLAFKGDVYEGIHAADYGDDDWDFAQNHVRILSGLYGLLKPLDLMQPYRLEMGTQLKTRFGKDLYAFWGESITNSLNQALEGHKNPVLINLASQEYFKAVNPKLLHAPVVEMVFKEKHKGALKIIGLHAKKARGMMAQYIIRNRLDSPADMKDFKDEGYRFEKALSSESQFVFVR